MASSDNFNTLIISIEECTYGQIDFFIKAVTKGVGRGLPACKTCAFVTSRTPNTQDKRLSLLLGTLATHLSSHRKLHVVFLRRGYKAVICFVSLLNSRITRASAIYWLIFWLIYWLILIIDPRNLITCDY